MKRDTDIKKKKQLLDIDIIRERAIVYQCTAAKVAKLSCTMLFGTATCSDCAERNEKILSVNSLGR